MRSHKSDSILNKKPQKVDGKQRRTRGAPRSNKTATNQNSNLAQQIEEYRFARPPLPSDFQYLQQMSDKSDQNKNNSNHGSDKSDTLQRLEVETTSTTSVPISFPYYYINEYNNSLDTFNLLGNNSSNNPDGPLYNNTSHNIQPQEYKSLNPNEYTPDTSGTTDPNATLMSDAKQQSNSPKSSGSHSSKIKNSISKDIFNQVPQRFSQFIVDQQQFNQKRPDELVLNTNTNDSSLDTDPDQPLARNYRKSRSSSSRKEVGLKNSSSFSHNRRSTNSVFEHNRAKASNDARMSRQISNSMESQATIFSTRQDETSLLKHSNHSSPSNASSLRRLRAIKSKEGGFLYRMKLRFKKWLSNIKKMKFSRIVPSKRTGNSLRRLQTRNRTLKRKYRANPKNPTVQKLLNISAPVNNLQLGDGEGAARVTALDDQLKYQAGAPSDNVNINQEAQDDHMKLNHLSEYIDQQQGLYLDDFDKKSKSINYGRDRSSESSKELDKINIDEIEEVSDYSSVPPPPPKHEYQQVSDESVVPGYGEMMELWKTYLANVVAKRIQLRQEIIMFQSMVVGQELKARKLSISSTFNSIYDIHEHPSAEDYNYLDGYESDDQNSSEGASDTGTITSSSHYTNDGSDSTAGYETITSSSNYSSSSATNSTSTEEIQPYVIDPNDEKFNRRYQNRQSVLSEMLDYESTDSDLTITSISENDPSIHRNHSLQESNLELGKQYSVKQKNLSRSFSSVSSPNNQFMSPIRRSNGIQTDLHMAA